MQTFDTGSLARVTTRKQEENLLAYFHRLCQALHKADLPGRLLLGKETKRVKAKVLFYESLEVPL